MAGRPPINQVAMTQSERTRRYREKQRKLAKAAERAAAKPVELIKPSDSWNWSRCTFPRLPSNADEHGYIPGDLYATALHYWSKPGDVVVAPMAGSGMILHVYEERAKWMKPGPWPLEIHAADLNPRGPYKHLIERRDVLDGLACQADLVIADIPYFGTCKSVYSDNPDDLGNMDIDAYTFAVRGLAMISSKALNPGGRVVIITAAAFLDHRQRRRIMLQELIVAAFADAGLPLVDKAFATRRIQQTQSLTQARMNTIARERRTMLSDMLVALCFSTTPAS